MRKDEAVSQNRKEANASFERGQINAGLVFFGTTQTRDTPKVPERYALQEW